MEKILARDGRAGIAAQAMLGHFIPQVYLMARVWLLESAERLFKDGTKSPLTRPIWGAYLTRSQFYNNIFRDLRPWYVLAANEAASEDNVDSQDRDWTPSRHLIRHVMEAVVRGLATVGDSDGLVERAFSNVSVADRNHTYWSIFRSWTDSKGQIAQIFIERLLQFWNWRLDQLESSNNVSERKNESIGLRWLLLIPYIPARDAIRLGRRTIALAGDDVEDRGVPLWGRLMELGKTDAVGAYEMTEHLIHEALLRDYIHLPFESVAPVLVYALNSGDAEIRKRAERLIHTMGDRELFEYGKLLDLGGLATNNDE